MFKHEYMYAFYCLVNMNSQRRFCECILGLCSICPPNYLESKFSSLLDRPIRGLTLWDEVPYENH